MSDVSSLNCYSSSMKPCGASQKLLLHAFTLLLSLFHCGQVHQVKNVDSTRVIHLRVTKSPSNNISNTVITVDVTAIRKNLPKQLLEHNERNLILKHCDIVNNRHHLFMVL
ncbi:hypothetical protein V8G54_009113 [Vigna mungo]|uniref:Uncharacterized protein n=1 Tax=Vigna mungo TaxID=3915 RepID=A0AAQ3NW49_VIGMU